MKSLKRVFALAVVFAMVLSSFSMAMAATTFEDVANDDLNVVNTLVGLGLIEGYEEDGKMLFKGDQTITRAEFATIICRLIAMAEAAASQRSTEFADVPATHWASGYVQTAADTNGIIAGYGDGNFGPEDKVTYEQAVKMIVCALGYQTKAEEEGTYPAGYIFVAKTLGLTSGVSGTVGQEATRMVVAKLLYNALDIPLMQKYFSGTKSSYYVAYDGVERVKKTVLSEYLGAVKLLGIVDGNSISDTALETDMVIIDIIDNYDTRATVENDNYAVSYYSDGSRAYSPITCLVGDTYAKELLGKRVEAYVTYETSKTVDPTILAIFESVNESNKITLDFDDIKEMEYNSSNDSYIVEYYTDKTTGKTKSFEIAATTSFYVNGESGAIDADDLYDKVVAGKFANSGAYTIIEFSLVGNKGLGWNYDYAFVSVYENFVVDSVDEVAEKVYAGLDSVSNLSAIEYDDDADAYELSIVDVEGYEVDPTELVEYDVVTMQVNPYNWSTANDIKAISGVLVQNSIDGTVTEVDGTEDEYYIDGVAYEMDPASGLTLVLDDAGTFYLDLNNKIVAFDQTSSKNSNYAVIVNSGNTSGVDLVQQVKMFTSDGVLEVRDFASKVKVPVYDGTQTTSTSYKDSEVAAMITSYPTVCSYKLNSAGEISSISFANGEMKATTASYKSAALVQNNTTSKGEIEAEGKEIKRVDADGVFYLDDNTKIIAMETIADATTAKIDNFEIYTVDDFSADQDFDNISVYDVDSNKYAGFVFLYDAAIELSSDAINVIMVKTATDINNAEGDATQKISGFNNAGAVSAVLDDETSADLGAGDVYFPKAANADGEVKKFVQVTDYDKTAGAYVLTSDFVTNYDNMIKKDSDSTFYFGKVDYKQKNTIYFNNLLDETESGLATKVGESIVIPNSVPVMVYDETKPSAYRVSYESAGYMSYATKMIDEETDGVDVNGDGVIKDYYPISDENVGSYYILVREYNGKVTDVVYYCYKANVDESKVTLPSTSGSGSSDSSSDDSSVDSQSIVADIVVDAIINDEIVIAE